MNKEEILKTLREATVEEADEYLNAALKRKRELCPDWEIWYIPVPKETPEEERLLDAKMRKIMAMDTLRIMEKFMDRKGAKLWERFQNGGTVCEEEEDLALMEELVTTFPGSKGDH